LLPGYESVFAINYDVPFVPIPLNNPMGKVVAGMMCFSGYKARSSERVSFQGNFKWPKNLFMLNRCFIMERYVFSSGKVLVMINTHNSAFDDGTLRKAELNLLRKTALDEYQKGNYVLVGGDWNLNPPGYELSGITSGDVSVSTDLYNASDHLMPEGWVWAFDDTTPSNRYVDEPYQKGKTKTTIIDYFLLSPNIQLINIKTIDLGFKYSDHNPVKMNVQLL
jgi:endonuclease/exonuclease/phosphatase family metal-dependent hydrolase